MPARWPGDPLAPPGAAPLAERELEARVWALESLLTERGLVSRDMVDAVVRAYEHDIGPFLGARVVARAWRDPAFRERLLTDATRACAELGIAGMQGEHMVCVANSPGVHNVVCCTLCSCYPWPVLGLPPTWYKEPQYRSRIVADPRGVLRDDFGLALPEAVEVRVWDSSAEIRYFVLPEPPVGAGGATEAELAACVTREAMIGVGRAAALPPRGPEGAA